MDRDTEARFLEGFYDISKTKYVVYDYFNAAYTHDREKAAKYLESEVVYEVDRVEQHDWYTDVYLKAFPGIAFNSVIFTHLD
jgi:hypothetical protein